MLLSDLEHDCVSAMSNSDTIRIYSSTGRINYGWLYLPNDVVVVAYSPTDKLIEPAQSIRRFQTLFRSQYVRRQNHLPPPILSILQSNTTLAGFTADAGSVFPQKLKQMGQVRRNTISALPAQCNRCPNCHLVTRVERIEEMFDVNGTS